MGSMDLGMLTPSNKIFFVSNHLMVPLCISAGITEGFSMCAGDFVEVYSHPGQAGMTHINLPSSKVFCVS